MKKQTVLLLLLIAIAYLQSCESDDFDTRTVPNFQTEESILRDEAFIAENFGNFTTGDFFGIVEDQYGGKLNNVQVTIGNTTAFTDRNGIFYIKDADVYENFAHIKTQKDGYINGSRVVIPKVDGYNKVQISMLKKEITASVNSGEFSTVSLPIGAKVNFSGGFVRQDGSTYTGQVDVMLTYLPPNGPSTFTQMPRSLFAQNTDNEARYLETLGMISVNLFSPSGEPLNINQFNRATIEVPILTDAPDFIPLWYFDEERGYWKEEGQAVRFANKYVAEVSHFTWWNCDVPFDSVNLCFSLSLTNTDTPTPLQTIIKRSGTNQFIYYGLVTANDTVECGLIPRDEEIEISVYGSTDLCNFQLIHSETLGGFSTDTTVDISFSSTNTDTSTITALATNCNGSPITNGYVFIDEINTYYISDGMINVNLTHCDALTATIQLYDIDSDQWAILENIPLDEEVINLGNISTCESSGGIYNGNLVLSNQQEVNDFGVFGFTQINGRLTIGNSDNFTDITDLSPLTSLTTITNDLIITGNENLTSFAGLENITTARRLQIINNPSITSLSGLNSLSSIYSVYIGNNEVLTSLVGFPTTANLETSVIIYQNNSLTSLQGIGVFDFNAQKSLRILDNDALVSLQGVEAIPRLNSLFIEDNDTLNSLNGFQSLTQVTSLIIDNNDALVTLNGLEQLTELVLLFIANNETLENLNGLDNLSVATPSIFTAICVGGRSFENVCDSYIDGPNPNLSDFCALQTFMTNNNWNPFGNSQCAIFANNAYNPSIQDIIDGNCSQ